MEVVVRVHLVSSYRLASVDGAQHCRFIVATAMPTGTAMKPEDQVVDLTKGATGNADLRERNTGIAAGPSYEFPCVFIGVIAG
jgi:hypothetical protein